MDRWRPHRSLLHHIAQAAVPFVCRDSFVSRLTPPAERKREKLAGPRQNLVNNPMSAGKREREKEAEGGGRSER